MEKNKCPIARSDTNNVFSIFHVENKHALGNYSKKKKKNLIILFKPMAVIIYSSDFNVCETYLTKMHSEGI